MRKVITGIVLFSFVLGAAEGLAQKKDFPSFGTGPGALPVIVYKTKKNYKDLVPITLSEDRTTVVSYPDPKDIRVGLQSHLPACLHKGYLLDRRGITRNTAFIKMTYKQYAKLAHTPSSEELYKMVVDKDPFTKFCICGRKQDFPIAVKKLNSLIDKKKLPCN